MQMILATFLHVAPRYICEVSLIKCVNALNRVYQQSNAEQISCDVSFI